MRGRVLVAGVLGTLLMCGVARADLLNLQVGHPLVTTGSLTLTYDADNVIISSVTYGRLAGNAFVGNYDPGTGGINLFPFGIFQVRIVVEPATGEPISGSLYVTGDVVDDGIPELLFNSSRLVEFGFGIDDKFEAVFLQDSGSLAGLGWGIGVIMDARQIPQFGAANSPIMPFFTADFAKTGAGGKADIFVIPEPATAILVLSGLALMAARGRRRAGGC